MKTHTIEGPVLSISGDIGADEILPPQHAALSYPAALAVHCFAGRPDRAMMPLPGNFSILVCSGLFGVGLVRPQVPAAMAGAGFRIVLAPAFSPLFVENALNGGYLLPLVAQLPALPETGVAGRILLNSENAQVEIDGMRTVWSHRLPEWALAGRRWIDVVQAQASAAGGLAVLQGVHAARQ